MPPQDTGLKRWWPTTQSLDLVEGPVGVVADAVQAEVSRFLNGERLVRRSQHHSDLVAAFGEATEFTDVPTFYLILPTHSRWSVLWNNSFLCDGYDSLCFCLTSNRGLSTIHWSAHDQTTVCLAGAEFVSRRNVSGSLVERSVHCSDQDGRWEFYTSGDPLPEEDTSLYAAARKRDRLNERHLLALLNRLGAQPWSSSFYALPEQDCVTLVRPEFPPSIIVRSRLEVLGAGSQETEREGSGEDLSGTCVKQLKSGGFGATSKGQT